MGLRFESERALDLLRIGTGQPDVDFRPGQEAAVRHVVEGAGRLLVVQRTGWGKSFVYFIAIRLLREAGMGPALLISPLLALMRNQLVAAQRMGVRAETINSDNREDWDKVFQALRSNEVDILLISPERLANEQFRSEFLAGPVEDISLIIVDEAHCISDWGHDFRPDYRLLERIIGNLPANTRVLATTATANNRVMDDLADVLGPDLGVSRGDLNRPSLSLQTMRLPSQAHRLAWLAEQLPDLPGHGIIYVLTVRDALQVSDWLQSRGIDVEAYYGAAGDRRPDLEDALLDNRLKALVATTALGMGFDKPDLNFVIHYQTPGSVVAYYQQVGRAGRAVDDARGILLSGEEEREIVDYFIQSAFPTREEVQLVLDALEAVPEGLSIPQLQRSVNLSKARIEKTVKLLSLESPAPLAKQQTRWQLTAARLGESFWQRAERLTALRREEQAQMQEYVDLDSGHMDFLIKALDGEPIAGESDRLPPLPTSSEPGLVAEAEAFLRRTSFPFEPRKRWPAGGMPEYGLAGNIPRELQTEEGRALCTWGDAGWGESVREGKYGVGRFPDDLVTACVELVEQWEQDPAPLWVTCVPSLLRPNLVSDFAERLAIELGLPFHNVLQQKYDRPQQKSMANSIQQALNIDGSLDVDEARVLPHAVLLVDDMVDSRWTFTVSSWLLRSHGCGEVWPLALARTTQGT